MPSLPPAPLRKRRTREHVIADLSINHVERFILRCGWVAQRMTPDYGVDLIMETFDSQGEVENDWVLFQVKATEVAKTLKKKRVIPVRLDWRDAVYWWNAPEPGILVVYDAAQDCAWWLHLQDALGDPWTRQHRPITLTLHVPLEHRLDERAIRHFAQLRNSARLRTEEDER